MNCFCATALVFVMQIGFRNFVTSARDEAVIAFDTWKFRDYDDYDIVKWGSQRGVCQQIGFCNEPLTEVAGVPVPLVVDRLACDKRKAQTDNQNKNILYKKEEVFHFCGIACSTATDCSPDENCCDDPCGMKICTKVKVIVPREQKKCPTLLYQCKNKFKCIRTDHLCDGFDDCGNNEDERSCRRIFAPVVPHGIQNGGQRIFLSLTCFFTSILLLLLS